MAHSNYDALRAQIDLTIADLRSGNTSVSDARARLISNGADGASPGDAGKDGGVLAGNGGKGGDGDAAHHDGGNGGHGGFLGNGGHGLYAERMTTSAFETFIAENCGLAMGIMAPIHLYACESSIFQGHVEKFSTPCGVILEACQEIEWRSGLVASWQNKGWTGIRLTGNTSNCSIASQRVTDYASFSVKGDGSVTGCTIAKQQRPVDGLDWRKNFRLW